MDLESAINVYTYIHNALDTTYIPTLMLLHSIFKGWKFGYYLLCTYTIIRYYVLEYLRFRE